MFEYLMPLIFFETVPYSMQFEVCRNAVLTQILAAAAEKPWGVSESGYYVKLSMDGDTGFAWNRILALSLISILPQLIVFFCAQDQFVEGISAGAVKG